MKKIYAMALVLGLSAAVQAQVTCTILEPASVAGSYDHTWADPADGWVTPDMNDPANLLVDTLAIAFDGTDADSLGCDTIINPQDIAGKIAVIVRGTCNFSLKAYFCQKAGAVGVLIVNNQVTSPSSFTMTPGTNADSVTVPVFLIEQMAGQAVRNRIFNGETVVALLGNPAGFFTSDAGVRKQDIVLPPSTARPAVLTQNAADYSPVVGAWLHNFGTSDLTGVSLTVKVTQDGVQLYDQTSSAVDIVSGDSVLVTMPPIAFASYSGDYTLNYLISSAAGDDYQANNTYSTGLSVRDVYSYAPIDTITGLPKPGLSVKPNPSSGDYSYCVAFRDANASRVAAMGMHVRVATNATSTTPTLDGQLVYAQVYEWTDEFTGLSDPNFDIATLNQINDVETLILEDTTVWSSYIPFSEPLLLQDNMRYLFCLVTSNADIFIGADNTLDYNATEAFNDQPVTPLQNGSTWNTGFIATQCAHAVRMIDANTIGIDEKTQATITPYPNPTNDVLHIPFNQNVNNAQLRILSLAGQVVNEQRVSSQGRQLQVNVSSLAAGTYQFELTNNGQRTSFKVMVNR